MRIRRLFCVLFGLALAGCGGGGGAGPGTQASPIQIAYASLNGDLFTSLRGVPSISGASGKSFQCAVTSGSLPAGLALASDCSIGGSPTQLGSFGATVTMTVDGLGSVAATLTVLVTPPTLQKIRDGSGGSADQQLRLLAAVAGLPVVKLAQGAGLYAAQAGDVLVYSVSSGSLPPGLALNTADGSLSGTPSVFGSWAASISLSITHAGQTFTTAPVLLTFNTVEGPFTLSYFDCCISAFVGDAVDMIPVSTYVPVPGATSRFTFDASSAPPGVALDPVTGVYSGRLASAGTALSVVITQTVTYPDGTTSSAHWNSMTWTVLATAPPQLQYMQQVGSLGAGSLSISVTPTQFNGTTPPQVSGSINMAGFIGALGVNIGAPVATMAATDLVDPTGRPYVSLVLVSKPFQFVDLTTGARTVATMRSVSDNLPGTRGHLAFTVTSVATGAVLASTGIGGGPPIALPLTTGSTSMKGF